MAKYHINPESGNPGVCRARVQCRFGGAEDHYDSLDDAREAYEASMGGVLTPLKETTGSDLHKSAEGLQYRAKLVAQRRLDGIPKTAKVIELDKDNILALTIKADIVNASDSLKEITRVERTQVFNRIYKGLTGRGRLMGSIPEKTLGRSKQALEEDLEAAGFAQVWTDMEYNDDGNVINFVATKPAGKRKNLASEYEPTEEIMASGAFLARGSEMQSAKPGATLTLTDGRTFVKAGPPYSDSSWNYKKDTYKYDKIDRLEPGRTYDQSYIVAILNRVGGRLEE